MAAKKTAKAPEAEKATEKIEKAPERKVVAPKQWEGAVELALDLIEPDPANVNVMTPQTFNELVTMIQDDGFDEPIQVAPLMGEDGKRKLTEDGREKFVIIGGEHRFKAATVLGMNTVPSVIKNVTDEAKRRMSMVKRNMVRGELDRVKFNSLVKDLQERHKIEQQLIAKGMGFSNDRNFGKYFKAQKEEKDAKATKMFDESRKEIMLVDNLSYVLSEVCGKYGETMPAGWLWFCYKNKLHLMLQTEADLYKAMQVLVAFVKRSEKDLNGFLNAAIRKELVARGVKVDDFKFEQTDGTDDVVGETESEGADPDTDPEGEEALAKETKEPVDAEGEVGCDTGEDKE